MDQPLIKPDFDELGEMAQLRVELIDKLDRAVKRIKSVESSTATRARVLYNTSYCLKVAVWDVTEKFAIDENGNILAKWTHEVARWPGVLHECIRIDTVGRIGEMKLCRYLDDVCQPSS